MFGHGGPQRREPFPRVLGEEPQRDVVGRAAPALQAEQLGGQPGDVRRGGHQVARAHPGGEQGLVRVAEGGVGDGHGLLRAEPGGETVGTERGELLARPVHDRTVQVHPRQLVDRLDPPGPRPVRLVHRRLGEVAEDPGAAVGRAAALQQVRPLVDEARGDPAGAEVGVVEHRGEERQVRRDAADAELGDGPPGPADGVREGVAVAGELDQHGVEVRADLGRDVRAPVEPDTWSARRAVGADHARVRPEAVGRVLGGDPALQRGAVDMDLLLLQVHLGQRHAGRDPELGDHQVAAGDLLGDGVLDLDARVHLDEHVLPALVEQELHRAGVDVADVAGERDGVGADAVADTRVQVLGRGDLDHLLVAPLQGAVALVEVHDSARGVGEDLHLDVPRVDHGALQEHRRVAERGLRLAHGGRDGLAQLPRLVDAAHPAPAAARHRLDEQREAQLVRRRDELLDLRGRRRRPEHRQARLPGGGDGAGLVAGQVQHLRRRPDERDAGVRTGLRQIGVLRQESVSGVDRVRARPPGSGDHLVDRQVGPHGVAALADHVRLVGLRAVQRVAVLVREHRDGRQFELVGRTEGADRDLTTVGDEQLAEHGTPRVRPSAR